MLAMSMVFGCVSERLSCTSSVIACITILKPRSLLAWSPISLIAAYEPPAWTSVTSLVFCAQTVGNPVTAWVAAIAPPAAAPLRRSRRLIRFMSRPPFRPRPVGSCRKRRKKYATAARISFSELQGARRVSCIAAVMEIGVFIPIGSNGWIVSTTSPQYKPSFELNKQTTLNAERYGLDFVLSMIKLRGFGGKSEFWDHNLEFFTLMAGLAAMTERIKLFATVPTLAVPPAICARMCLDHRLRSRTGGLAST